MIKGSYGKDDSLLEARMSLQKILADETVSEIGEAGLLDSDILNSLGMGAMTARSEIPLSHRRIADSYILMKKVYGMPVVKGCITREENAVLRKYDFNRLEYSTIRQINEEIAFLQQAAISMNRTLRVDSDKILEIRAKELKFLSASRYTLVTNEIYKGYMALERYFEIISTYSKPSRTV
ncbi:hypothetical protein IJG14_01850 [bacterium]|nr:hypothetical protein [bacterium]